MPVSLHTHSWYSLLEGASAPEALLARAAACGYTALALTDSNNLYGAVAFAEAAPRYGVRPLLGACLRSRRRRCVALVGERAGYRNLCRVLSRLHLDAAGPPDLAELLSACADGLHVLVEDPALAERLREAFGARLWLEVVRPPRSPEHERVLLAAGRRLGLRPVASTAAHFATADDYPAFRLAAAVRQTTLLERVPARLAVTPDHHLADAAALRRRFRDLPAALRHADALAEQLRADVLPHEVILPQPRLREGLGAGRYLRRLCERGLRRRELGDSLAARQRLREELALVEAAGLAGYFLVVRDLARYARRKGHGIALRGSAGNSLVCYLLEITDVDPLRFNLALDRFLHPGRRDLPDIDLDFDWKVRDDVMAYARRRHGPRHTAQISSHLFLQPRSALREAAKVHGLSDGQVSQLVERLAERADELLREEEEWQMANGKWQMANCPAGFPLEPERWPRILADARLLLGRPHHLSIHPGGIVITPRPTEEYAPLQMAPKGVVVTQFEKDAVEHVGLVKIDLLGNRALATVDEAVRLTAAPDNLPFAICHLPFAIPSPRDPATIDLLRRGDTLGINQLESPAMRHLLVQVRASGIDDVIQCLALVRPGAASDGAKELFLRRRRGLEPVDVYPPLEPLLRETCGLMLYEDDALRVVQALTGLPAADADRLRCRAAEDHPDEEGRRLGREFAAACAHNGVPRAVAEEQWCRLGRFRHYTFCKSHAVSYGLIAWRAAYLKAHHPAPFWTAALNNNQGVYPRRVYVEAVKRAGIPLRLPCVNRSQGPFTLEGGAVRTGLDAVAGLAQELRLALLAERDRNGPYRDLADFRRRVRPGPEALALLIGCGALDFTGRPRPALFLEAELQGPTPLPAAELFPAGGAGNWSPANYAAGRRRNDEWRLLGFVVGPPLMALYRPRLPHHLVTSRELPEHLGRPVHVAGLTATARHTRTAQGRPMQFITLEDEWGFLEVVIFPGACPPVPYLTLGPYVVAGTVEEHHGVLAVRARSFQRFPVTP
jgi:DNA-directed DNA polymerase III PolC